MLFYSTHATILPSKRAVEASIVRVLCDPTGYTIPAQLLKCYKHSIGQLQRKGIIFLYKIIHQLVEIYPTNLLTRSEPRIRQYPHSYSYRLLQTTKYSYKYSFSNIVLHGYEFDASFVEFTFCSCQTVSTVLSYSKNNIGGVMVSVLTSSVIYRGYKPRSDQSKDYKIGIGCFSAKHAALRRKNKDSLDRNQDNVSECISADCCFSELAL